MKSTSEVRLATFEKELNRSLIAAEVFGVFSFLFRGPPFDFFVVRWASEGFQGKPKESPAILGGPYFKTNSFGCGSDLNS